MHKYLLLKEDTTVPEIHETQHYMQLDPIQKLVGGSIDEVRLDQDGHIAFVDDEGRLKEGMKQNINFRKILIMGPALIGKINEEGEFTGCNIEYVKRKVLPNI